MTVYSMSCLNTDTVHAVQCSIVLAVQFSTMFEVEFSTVLSVQCSAVLSTDQYSVCTAGQRFAVYQHHPAAMVKKLQSLAVAVVLQ